MIIELMIMLIVVGAGIVFVAWSNTRRRKQDALERREVEDSTGKLKQELERTATEIIGRMEKHVTHLESILDESERNRTQLEGRVVELKKILKKAEGQSGEIRDLLAKLEDAGAEVDTMQRKMEKLERRLNTVMSTPLPVQQPIQQSIQQPVTIPQMTTPLVNPLIPQMTTPITAPPISQMTTPITAPPIPSMTTPITAPPIPQMTTPITTPPVPPINKPTTQAPVALPPIAPKPVATTTPATVTKVTTTPPAPPMNPLGPITVTSVLRTSSKVEEPDKDFDKILEESIAEKPKREERPQARESIVLSSKNKQPVKAIEADPVKIEATRKRLNEVSAEMAAHPPEDISDEFDPKDLKKKRPKKIKRDVRKAAIEAIKEVEKQNEVKAAPVAEPKKVIPLEKPKSLDKKEQLLERRDLKLETTDSSIIKEMLLAGMSIEDISRETGLGRGAIELIQEMTRRQLDRK
ncbi:MAG: hypothetical protein IKT98_12185 [Selenomonadaceae bacterium]|nr:hypothetical protein [Selenomonadaceae bacterium]